MTPGSGAATLRPLDVHESGQASIDLDSLPDEQYERVYESIMAMSINPYPPMAVCLDRAGNVWKILFHRVRLIYSVDSKRMLIMRVIAY
jgi:hypothetical protein